MLSRSSDRLCAAADKVWPSTLGFAASALSSSARAVARLASALSMADCLPDWPGGRGATQQVTALVEWMLVLASPVIASNTLAMSPRA